jgi:hypothetical protein
MTYLKTEEGQAAFKERSALMSTRQRSLFLLIDGVKSADQILTLTKALSITQLDIDHLVELGFIKNKVDPISVAVATSGLLTPQQRFAKAWPMATQLTAGMGIRGFRLNLAIEAASGFDDLLILLPKIQAAVGAEKCAALEQVLKS